MQFLVFILVYPFLWMISILPFRILYLFSDCVYILIYYVFGYRKKTVKDNLTLCFPNKTESELKIITKKFYHHLCDMFLEMIKTMSISRDQLAKRFKIINPEEFQRLESLNKSIILMYGHYASWEWSIVIENYINYKGYGVYKKLANTYFDKLARDIRSKFNTTLISTKDTVEVMNTLKKKDIKSITAFISDQSPRISKDVYWSKFMGVNVPCFTGAERLAKKLNFTIAYLKINKVKRGYYEAEVMTLAENPKDFKDYELTETFISEVEKQIYEAPEFYFWTHKRWKHKDKAPK
jgi:Kdo2-lipid IVA lauroyltransferase/acyltransferase